MGDIYSSGVNLDDDRPIALRKKRRGTSVTAASSPVCEKSINPYGLDTPPATPHRTKRVRFSHAEPKGTSTGITPFIRRTSLHPSTSPSPSPSRKRSRTSWNLSFPIAPLSGSLQFAPLRQVLDGRVQRRIRRNRLSEEFNTIETEKKGEKACRLEIHRLEEALRQKDAEIQYLRNEDLDATISDHSGSAVHSGHMNTRVQELEAEVVGLRLQLERQHSVASEQMANWAIYEQDPFDDDNVHFNDEMTEVVASTPIRQSILSPPTTGPNTPMTPSVSMNASAQVSIPDPQKEQLETQLKTLQTELETLTAALERSNERYRRVSGKISDYIDDDTSEDPQAVDAALDTVLTQLAFSQSAALENKYRFSALKKDLTSLGFSSSPEKTVELLHFQFRKARIDLEYLNPGEIPQGFENAKLIEMLISRLRLLTAKVEEQDDDIDQYHEQELSLRQQLSARVDVTSSIHAALTSAQQEIMTLTSSLEARDEDVSRLTGALSSYRDEVKSLEHLITSLEKDYDSSSSKLTAALEAAKKDGENEALDENLRAERIQATADGQEIIIHELETRLHAALDAKNVLETEMAAQTQTISTMQTAAAARERDHGLGLALRDARVSELRKELIRVNASLKDAHETVMALKIEHRTLAAQIKERKNMVRDSVDAIVTLATGIRDGGVELRLSCGRDEGDSDAKATRHHGCIVRPGGLLDAGAARRSGKGVKRKSCDSGLAFLGEDGEGDNEELHPEA